MVNVYYGDGGVSAVDGNWNNVANWFSSLGTESCCTEVPGTALGRVPNAATDSVILTSGQFGAQIILTTGPTGGYSGTLQNLPNMVSVTHTDFEFSTGVFSGEFTWHLNVPGTLVIAGGTFSGEINNIPVNAPSLAVTIEAGDFTGFFSHAFQLKVGSTGSVIITGGTFTPAANIMVTGNVVNYSGIPADPGFALGGGTYAPVLTITNLPDILGAGLPA